MGKRAGARIINHGLTGKWPALDDDLGLTDGIQWTNHAWHREDPVFYPYLIPPDHLSSSAFPKAAAPPVHTRRLTLPTARVSPQFQDTWGKFHKQSRRY